MRRSRHQIETDARFSVTLSSMPEPQQQPLTHSRQRLLWALHLFGLLAVLWVILGGWSDPLPGLVFALLGAAIGVWLVPGEPYRWRPIRLVMFAGWFLKASWVGGLDVSYRALHPQLPIKPLITEHPVALPAGLPRTTFVAVLSLLPGTLAVALDDNGKVLRVHALTPKALDGIEELEAHLRELFSLTAGKGQAS